MNKYVRENKNSRRIDVLIAFRNNPGSSVRELAECVGMSVSAVHYHLDSLEREGLITERNHKVGRHGKYRKSKVAKRISGEELSKVRMAAAKKPRRRDTSDALQSRIDAIVSRAIGLKG
jgi:predicted ArsR family transcriptional regulator